MVGDELMVTMRVYFTGLEKDTDQTAYLPRATRAAILWKLYSRLPAG
jgi:hypothetical protein